MTPVFDLCIQVVVKSWERWVGTCEMALQAATNSTPILWEKSAEKTLSVYLKNTFMQRVSPLMSKQPMFQYLLNHNEFKLMGVTDTQPQL